MSRRRHITPRCPVCLSGNTRRSRTWRQLLKPLPLRAYRCRHCYRRFWKFSGEARDWLPAGAGLAGVALLLALLRTFG